jgi:trimeric autotransporter adhesin
VKLLPRLIALVMLSFLVACGSSSSTPSAPTLRSIAVTPANPSVAAGLTQQFAATGTYSDSSTKDLTNTATWASSATGIATVSSAGLATSKAPGTSTIGASSGSVSGSALLTVTAPTLVSIAVTPANATIAPGTFLQFKATGTYTDGSTQDLTGSVTWATGDATIVSINAAGLGAAIVELPTGVGAVTTITAASGSISGNTPINVAAPTLNSIVISDGNVTIAAGTSHQFTALGIYSDGGQRNVSNQVTWGSSATNIATISATGQAAGVALGTSSISATLGSVSATAVTLNVTSATVATIVVAPVMNTLAPLTHQPFFAVGVFSDSSTQDITRDVTWSSSNPGVATVDTTNQLGLVTAVSAGPATISADLGGVTGHAPLIVSSATLTSITFRPTSAKIPIGANIQVLAIGNFSDGSTQFITQVATWSSSDSTIADVNDSGDVLGTAAGQATITASLAGVSNPVDITVEGLTSLAVTPTSTSIPAGAIAHLIATATLTDGSTQNVNTSSLWTSSAPSVALAGDSSDSRSEVFGLTPGSALIGTLFFGQISSATVTVTPATLVSLAVTPVPANASIPIDGTQGYKLTGTYSDGTTQVLTSQAKWSSSTVTTAIVSQTGVATPTGLGTTTISAEYQGVTGTAVLTVQ